MNRVKLSVLRLIQGAIVGIGAILPGVSGGILCVIFGIYEPLMELLTEPFKTIKKQYKLFVPFILGWLLGFVLLARVTERFFNFAPDIATFLFFGLVCGSIPALIKQSETKGKTGGWIPFVISLAASYIFFHLVESGNSISLPLNFWSFLLCGFLWGLSLIVPGLCSATLLLHLGLYVPFADGVANFDLNVIIPFLIGVVAIVLLFAKLVDSLFKKHHTLMMRIILGFVISSSLKTLPNTFNSPLALIIALICCALGFFVAIKMDGEKEY